MTDHDSSNEKKPGGWLRKTIHKIRGNAPDSDETTKKRRRPGRRHHKTTPDLEVSMDATEEPAPKKKPRNRKSEKPKEKQAPAVVEDNWTPPEIPEIEGELRFSDIGLHPSLFRAVTEMGFEYCTPIQKEALLAAISGKDLTGRAQTGTGKTAAFLLAAMNKFLNNPLDDQKKGCPRALVLAPTRELAIQIHKDANAIGAHSGLNSVAVYGGMNYKKQQDDLHASIDVLVATPGRLLDFIRNRQVDLRRVEVLIIDEADRMLDMGFIPDVKSIERRCPKKEERQTLMWSATFSDSIMRLVNSWLKDPVKVEVDSGNVVAELVQQIFYSVAENQKLHLLFWHLQNDNVERMLVFSNRKDHSSSLYKTLMKRGINCAMLSGDISQKKRIRVLEDFRSGKVNVIVATDVAARGIHVDNVSHVINWDLPFEVEDYIHRVGRTGRAGETGKAISMADEYGSYVIPDLEEFLETKIECTLPPEEMTEFPLPDEDHSIRVDLPGRGGGGSGGGGQRRERGNRGGNRGGGRGGYRGNRGGGRRR